LAQLPAPRVEFAARGLFDEAIDQSRNADGKEHEDEYS
jgi:hypothetical protein